MSPMIKRHKSLGPNVANIQPTIAYLEKIEFDELSKENFPEFGGAQPTQVLQMVRSPQEAK